MSWEAHRRRVEADPVGYMLAEAHNIVMAAEAQAGHIPHYIVAGHSDGFRMCVCRESGYWKVCPNAQATD